ncbi:MAG: hypothetical protein HY078_13435 [Elusimicrobia bacterium]|nr:hypothetical protein [Elusimicrobiota bacterium]
MKDRHAKDFAQKRNPHDNAGSPERACPKCAEKFPPKPGFRFTSLKCPKCGAALGKR